MQTNKADVLSLINPQMKRVLAKQQELAGDAFATDVGFEEMRENYVRERRFWNEGGPRMARIVDDAVTGMDGSTIPVRYYYPSIAPRSIEERAVPSTGEQAARSLDEQAVPSLSEQAASSPEVPKRSVARPAIVYIHGGGFVVGSPDTHDRITRMLADRTGAVVVSVDYPLSPEAKYPAALEACVSVARYLHEQGAAHGIDGEDLSFAGDSGGANLSLASFLYLRDEDGDASFVRSLLLFYGMYGLKDSRSYRLYGGPWDGMDAADMDYYFDCYCADKASDLESPYLNCFNADLERDVPPCYIAAARYDPLLDDSLLLAEMLETAGLRCELEVFDGVLHAFLHHSRMLDAAQRALDHGASFFNRVHTAFLQDE